MFVNNNDDCPCQSGVLYKSCCHDLNLEKEPWFQMGDKKIIEAKFAQNKGMRLVLDLIDTFLPKILNYSIDDQLMHFFEDDVYKLIDKEHWDIHAYMVEELFFPWLICHYPFKPVHFLTEGMKDVTYQSILGSTLENDSTQLTPSAKTFLQGLDEAPFSFYTLTQQKDPNNPYNRVMRDVMLDEEYVVFDQELSEEITVGDLVYAKIVRYKGINIMFDMFPETLDLGDFMKLLDLKAELKQEGVLTKEALRYRLDDRLRRFYFQRTTLLHASPPLRNTDYEPVDCHEIICELEKNFNLWGSELDCFLPFTTSDTISADVYNITTDKDLNDDFCIDWCRRGNTLEPTWQKTVLGTMRFRGNLCITEVNSKERADFFKQLITKHLGERARVIEIKRLPIPNNVIQYPTKITRRFNQFLDVGDNTISGDVSMLDDWLDTPIGILHNLTPRQAVQDPVAREKLEALLLNYEQFYETARQEHPHEQIIPFDLQRVRQELLLSA